MIKSKRDLSSLLENTTINVLFIWEVKAELKQHLQSAFKESSAINLIFTDSTEEEHLTKLAKDADIIVGWRASLKLLETSTKAKLVINPGTGIQHYIETFKKLQTERDITLVNGHGNAFYTAQHAVGLLLSLTNRIVQHHQYMVDGKWRTGDKEGSSIPLRGRQIGLLGYGHINRYVQQMIKGFDVDFHILKRSGSESSNTDKFYKPNQLHQFLKAVDVLIIAIPHTTETENLIGKEELELLGSNGLLINIARGKVVNEEALYNSLNNNAIQDAAIDVWYEYSPEEDDKGKKHPYSFPFHKLDNIILSPHRAASPFNSLKRWDDVIHNIKRFSSNQPLQNVVDIDLGY